MSYKAKILAPADGGTGVNNASNTLTLAGTLATVGAFASTFTMTAGTSVTFPTSGTLATTAQLPSITATQYDVLVGGAANAIASVGPGSAGQLLQSGGNAANPAYSTSTYPATNAVSTLLYASSANVMAALATANNGVLVTSSGGVPSIGSTLPSAVQGNITSTGNLGNQTNTTRCCFLVNLLNTVTNTTGNGTVYKVLFTTTIYDQASNITLNSSGNTIFTAPVTGKYYLNFFATYSGVTVADTDVSTQITTTGRNYANANINPGVSIVSGIYESQISCIADMTAGDTAYCQMYMSGSTQTVSSFGAAATQPQTYFQGYLLC